MLFSFYKNILVSGPFMLIKSCLNIFTVSFSHIKYKKGTYPQLFFLCFQNSSVTSKVRTQNKLFFTLLAPFFTNFLLILTLLMHGGQTFHFLQMFLKYQKAFYCYYNNLNFCLIDYLVKSLKMNVR